MSRFFIRGLFLITLFTCGLVFTLNAQTKSNLQQKKKKLQKEIQYTNKLLKETEKSKKASLNQLRQLNKKISSRESLIATMEQEIILLQDSINLQIGKIDSLENDLEDLKEEYAEMIRNAYKNRSSYNKLMFVFSADNFNQAYKRLKYFQQYAQFRQAQANKIKEQQTEIDLQIGVLEAIKASNEGLLKAKLNERNVLAAEKGEKQNVVESLKGKESQLRKQLKEKQKASKEITKAIERVIAEEIRKAREAAKKAGKKDEGFPMTPEARELSNSFAANKGKLPWPVNEGIITAQFGEHPHPTLKDVKVQNNGIGISTGKDNIGRAIFDGVVTRVMITREGKVVMVSHGDYFSVYSFFKEVYVSTGDKLTTKQNIGVLISDPEETSSTMSLEIWKMYTKLNPELWIFKK